MADRNPGADATAVRPDDVDLQPHGNPLYNEGSSNQASPPVAVRTMIAQQQAAAASQQNQRRQSHRAQHQQQQSQPQSSTDLVFEAFIKASKDYFSNQPNGAVIKPEDFESELQTIAEHEKNLADKVRQILKPIIFKSNDLRRLRYLVHLLQNLYILSKANKIDPIKGFFSINSDDEKTTPERIYKERLKQCLKETIYNLRSEIRAILQGERYKNPEARLFPDPTTINEKKFFKKFAEESSNLNGADFNDWCLQNGCDIPVYDIVRWTTKPWFGKSPLEKLGNYIIELSKEKLPSENTEFNPIPRQAALAAAKNVWAHFVENFSRSSQVISAPIELAKEQARQHAGNVYANIFAHQIKDIRPIPPAKKPNNLVQTADSTSAFSKFLSKVGSGIKNAATSVASGARWTWHNVFHPGYEKPFLIENLIGLIVFVIDFIVKFSGFKDIFDKIGSTANNEGNIANFMKNYANSFPTVVQDGFNRWIKIAGNFASFVSLRNTLAHLIANLFFVSEDADEHSVRYISLASSFGFAFLIAMAFNIRRNMPEGDKKRLSPKPYTWKKNFDYGLKRAGFLSARGASYPIFMLIMTFWAATPAWFLRHLSNAVKNTTVKVPVVLEGVQGFQEYIVPAMNNVTRVIPVPETLNNIGAMVCNGTMTQVTNLLNAANNIVCNGTQMLVETTILRVPVLFSANATSTVAKFQGFTHSVRDQMVDALAQHPDPNQYTTRFLAPVSGVAQALEEAFTSNGELDNSFSVYKFLIYWPTIVLGLFTALAGIYMAKKFVEEAKKVAVEGNISYNQIPSTGTAVPPQDFHVWGGNSPAPTGEGVHRATRAPAASGTPRRNKSTSQLQLTSI